MILAFFREELYGSVKPPACLDSPGQSFIGHGAVQEICLSSQFCRRMSIRIGDQLIPVESGYPPVHRRIRGQSRLHGMDIGRQILKTFLYCIKAGKRAEERKMRRPDMCGDIHCGRAQLQYNFQQITTVQSQNRAPVRMNVSDLFQLHRYPFRIFQARKQNKAVHLSHLIIFLIN